MSVVARKTDLLAARARRRRQAGRGMTLALVGLAIFCVVALGFAVTPLGGDAPGEANTPVGQFAARTDSRPARPGSFSAQTAQEMETSIGGPSGADEGSPTRIASRAPDPTGGGLVGQGESVARRTSDTASEWATGAEPAGLRAGARDPEVRFDPRSPLIDDRSASGARIAPGGTSTIGGDSNSPTGSEQDQAAQASGPAPQANSRLHETKAQTAERARNLLNLRRASLGLPPEEAPE